MTVGELRALLADYPDDTPVVDGKGYDFRPSLISRTTVDSWEGIQDEEGYETPVPCLAVAIGRRF